MLSTSNTKTLTSFACLAIFLVGCAVPGGSGKDAKAKAGTTASKSAAVAPAAERNFSRAVSMIKNEQYQDAEPLLLKLTQEFPNLRSPLINLGIVYLRTERVDDAVNTFRKLVQLNPTQASGHNYLGVALRTKGEFENARKAYEQAIAVDPNFADAYLNLGVLHDLYLSQPSKALSYYEKYKQLANADEVQRIEKWIADVQRRNKPAVNASEKQ